MLSSDYPALNQIRFYLLQNFKHKMAEWPAWAHLLLQRHPVATEEDVAVSRVEVRDLILRKPHKLLAFQHEGLHPVQVLVPLHH